MPRATLMMRSSRSRAKPPRLCQGRRPKSRGDFWTRTVPRRPGTLSTRSMKIGPAGFPFEWEEVRLDVMEALGRKDEAQAFRWRCFERTLNSAPIYALISNNCLILMDVEAEERAMSYAVRFPNVHQALAFMVSWPALDKAAALVIQRSGELDGDHYEILSPAADALAAKYPLAATLLTPIRA